MLFFRFVNLMISSMDSFQHIGKREETGTFPIPSPGGSRCGGKEDAANRARRRRRVSQAKLFFIVQP